MLISRMLTATFSFMHIPRQALVRGLSLILCLVIGGCQSADLPESQSESAAIDRSLHQVAESAERSGDYGSAMQYYEQLYRKDPDDIDALIGYARNLRYTGSPGRGAQLLEGSLEDGPENPRILSELGRAQLSAGSYDRASSTLSDAIEVGGSDWRTYVALGIAQDQLGQHDRARLSYDAALSLSPDNAVILTNMGLSQALAGNLKTGISLLERAILTPGADSRARQNLALLYGIDGKFDAARKLGYLDLPDEVVEANIKYFRALHEKRRAQSDQLSVEEKISSKLRQTHISAAEAGVVEFRIEVGAFTSIDEAIQAWERLQLQNSGLLGKLGIEFVRSGPDAGARFLAWAGPFDVYEGAKRTCAELEKRSVGCWVVQR